MAKFEYFPPDDDCDRAYVHVDDIFDINLLRTEEGLLIDVHAHDESEVLGSLAIEDPLVSKMYFVAEE